jgi:hypothetical protein
MKDGAEMVLVQKSLSCRVVHKWFSFQRAKSSRQHTANSRRRFNTGSVFGPRMGICTIFLILGQK